MIKRFSALQYTIAGWTLYVTALVVSVWQSPANCGWLTRWNVFDSAPAAIVFVLSLVAFAGAGVRAWQTEQLPRATKVLLALLACAYVMVPFNTHDISYYYGIGQAAGAGINVYDGDWTYRDDYSCTATNQTIHGVMYGPVAVWLMAAMAKIAPQPVAFALVWKLSLVAVLWGCVRLMTQLIPTVSKREVWAFLLLQPLILWETIGSGHFDLWCVLSILWAAVLAKQGKWWWVLPVLAIGLWVKFLPLLVIPWFALWWWDKLTPATWRRDTIAFVSGGVIAGVITVAAWYSFWSGPQILTPIVLQTKWAVSSVFAAIYYALRPLADWGLGDQAHYWLTRVVQGGLFGLVVYLLWPQIRAVIAIVLRKKHADTQWYLLAITLMYLVYVMIWQKSFWPWYVTWVLPLLYVIWHQTKAATVRRIGMYLSAAPLGFYAIWILNHTIRHMDAASEWWFYATVVLLVWGYPFAQLWQWRRHNYQVE